MNTYGNKDKTHSKQLCIHIFLLLNKHVMFSLNVVINIRNIFYSTRYTKTDDSVCFTSHDAPSKYMGRTFQR